MSAWEVDEQNFEEIDTAVMNLRMREETRFLVDFFANISIYFFVRASSHIFWVGF